MSDQTPRLALDLTTEQKSLWQKLAAFGFDADSAAKPFSARLATENGWTPDFAARVLEEYRRFLFLTAVAGHVVCPSEEVDAVWHQHLTFSRSYWSDLCQATLGYPLHHDPTAGGPAEGRKHWEMYRRTLASYRRLFGEEPPRDIWPFTFERFDPHSQPRTVNLRDHWIVRKPAWWRCRLGRRSGVMAAIFPVAAVGLGPLDWTGPDFLLLYVALYVIFLIAAIIYRRMQRDLPITEELDLTPEEIACLTFGRPAVVNATIAGMLHDQQLVAIPPKKSILGTTNGAKVTFAPGTSAPSHERALASALYREVQMEPKLLKDLQQALANQTEAVADRLESAGYLMKASQMWPAKLVPILAFLGLLGFGITKVWIGIERGRQVEFLIVACVVTLVTMLCMLGSSRRSLAGDRLQAALQAKHADLKTAMNAPNCAGSQVALGAALFGAIALQGAVFSDLKLAWAASAGGGAGGSSGCGAGGCGGGGGGGGCGGCGGGGGD